jgi:putative hydrolase of the HAD superfamily
MTRWILVDYGEVISAPQAADTVSRLATLAKQHPDEFRDRYWSFRPRYDLGQSDAGYWSEVLDRDLSADPAFVDQLVTVDVAGWMTLNPQTLQTLMEFAARPGVKLALLSNAPEPIALAIDTSTWSRHFDRRFYSCRLQLAKPDPAVFELVLRRLAASPESVLFIDDRAENIQAAARLGVEVARFTSADEMLRRLRDWESATQSRVRD